jgi:hypothetical protein
MANIPVPNNFKLGMPDAIPEANSDKSSDSEGSKMTKIVKGIRNSIAGDDSESNFNRESDFNK